MILEKKIRLNNIDYMIGIEVKYNANKFLNKINGGYFDCGDLSYLIKNVEKTYNLYNYCEKGGFINDIAFIYDRFPFLCYIRDVYYDKDGHITSTCKINKEEIIEIIDKYNIKMGLFDGKSSVCPNLYDK